MNQLMLTHESLLSPSISVANQPKFLPQNTKVPATKIQAAEENGVRFCTKIRAKGAEKWPEKMLETNAGLVRQKM
jgi:hypothetical protein